MSDNLMRIDERGNGILEMVLFVPFAILLLFVSIDLGLSFLDRAMVSDALRETTHEEIVSRINLQGPSVYRATASGVEIDDDLVENLSQKLGDRLSNVIIDRRINLTNSNSSAQVKVSVTPIKISIDPKDGKIIGVSKMTTYVSNIGNPTLNLGPKIKVVSDDDYIQSAFSSTQSDLGYAVLAANYSNSNILYLPTTLGFLISVEVLSPSINPIFLQQIFNSGLGIQLKDFHVVRS